MTRLFTLATISSTTAACRDRAGNPRASAAATASAAGVAFGRLVLGFADVLEGQEGAVDMNGGFSLELGQPALHHLVGLGAEELRFDPLLDVGEVGPRLLLADQLEQPEAARLRHDGADAAGGERLDRGAHLGRQLLAGVGARLPAVG